MSLSENLPASASSSDPMVAKAPASAGIGSAAGTTSQFEEMLVRIGDRLNPILVKEARQALKSRQFTVTFSLLLIGAWVLSVMGVAIIGASIHLGAYGSSMFYAYYIALVMPMLVIVPFGAFRSIASEQEDRTYELLSITTLRPRQIVAGKLGSAMLQMLLYLSAISPCLGFTYLLRGIDLPTILLIVFYTLLASIAASLIGLYFGTLFRQRHWQVVGSVALIAGLVGVCVVAVTIVTIFLQAGQMVIREEGFWEVNAFILTVYGSFFALIFVATSAQLTFASDNRSTALRVTMFAHPMLIAGWLAWALVKYPDFRDDDFFWLPLFYFGIYWSVLGAMLTGESANLGLRVRRGLPQTLLGRVVLSWFNPGPSTGYMFATANICAVAVLLGLTFSIGAANYDGFARRGQASSFAIATILVPGYVICYLGVGRWLCGWARRFGFECGVPATMLLQICLVALGTFVPLTIQMMVQMVSPTPGGFSYTAFQVTNPFWTILESIQTTPVSSVYISMVLVPLAALLALIINLPAVSREIRQLRVDKPARVAEEELLAAPAVTPPEPARTSPWD